MVTNPLLESLREAIREVVREEIKKALDTRASRTDYLSVAEAAEHARVKVRTVRRWLREGRIEKRGAGRGVRVRRDELQRLMDSGGTHYRARQVVVKTPEQLAREMD